jgi:hypothetical protein
MGVGASFAEQSPAGAAVGGIFAFLLFLMFRRSRETILVLACGSHSITSPISGAGMDKSMDFILAVQSAKDARYRLLAQAQRRLSGTIPAEASIPA